MSEEEELKKLLEDLKLVQYYENFLKEEVFYSDLESILEDDLLEIIPKRIHRRRLMKHLYSPREKGKREIVHVKRNEAEEVEVVQMLVKCENEVENVYDVPLDSTNDELVGKLLHGFLLNKSTVKLQDEKRELAVGMKSLTLRKWIERNERSLEDTVRAVLNVRWPNVEKRGGEVEKLEKKLEREKFQNEKIIFENAKLKKKVKELEKEKLALLEKVKGLERKEAGNREKEQRLLETAHNCLWGLKGERIDYYKPHKLYEEIENSGGKLDANANFNLGWMYEDGYGVEEDETKSEDFFKKAAEFYASKKVDDLKPMDWGNMGEMYVYGRGGFEENEKKGVELLKRAVTGGNVLTMRRLGICYQNGWGVEKSESESFKLYSKAAEMGFPSAINDLGFMYYNGHGVKKDNKKAFELYREGAENGHRSAMFNVGYFYEHGLGAEKNLEEAKKLYKMASDLGDEDARENLERLEETGTEDVVK